MASPSSGVIGLNNRVEWRGGGLTERIELEGALSVHLPAPPVQMGARYLRCLDTAIEDSVPAELELHLVVDDYATHKTPAVRRWLQRRPHIHLHFTPTSSSWLNLVQSFFSIVERRVTKRRVHKRINALESGIRSFLAAHNEDPKPFVWTKAADEILDSLKRYAGKAGALRAEKAKRRQNTKQRRRETS